MLVSLAKITDGKYIYIHLTDIAAVVVTVVLSHAFIYTKLLQKSLCTSFFPTLNAIKVYVLFYTPPQILLGK
jgi:hypothetical protein